MRKAPYQRFRDKLKQIENRWFLHPNKPGVLYHYTTWDGLDGIVSSRGFRAFSHRDTGDPIELAAADEKAKAVANELLKKYPGRKELAHFRGEYDKKSARSFLSTYISCFSAAADKEALWNRFGDRGAGVCIGVHHLLKEKIPLKSISLSGELLAVGYEPVDWEGRLNKDFLDVYSAWAEVRNATNEYGKIYKDTLSSLQTIAAANITAKTATLAYEEEWRFVFVFVFVFEDAKAEAAQNKSDAAGKRYIAPPMRSNGWPLDLAELIIGPKQDFATAKKKQS